MNNKTNIIATVGPSVYRTEVIKKIFDLGVRYFRLNGAHGSLKYINNKIREINTLFKNKSNIILDLPGNKIRTKDLDEPIVFYKGDCFEIKNENINYPPFFKLINKDDTIYANDSKDFFDVLKANSKSIVLKANTNGTIQNNKGLHKKELKKTSIPFLFDKDIELIKTGVDYKIEYLNLSYVRNINDIKMVEDILSKSKYKPKLIVKLETCEAVKNVESITDYSDFFLLDRGDLASEIGIENVPAAQEKIIKICKKKKKKLALATQFLISMISQKIPHISEVNDIYNVISQKVWGIQLSEETAVGKYPFECIKFINKVDNIIRKNK